MGSVTQVWRYPAKSMMGERRDAIGLDAVGVIGDRWYAVRDEERGGIRGAKKIGALMRLAARYVAEPRDRTAPPAIEVTLPDGTCVRSDADDVDARISAALDHPVTLWPLQPVTDVEHYRRGRMDSDDLLEELRGIFGREIDEPLPDISFLPPELLELESPLGTYVDAYPVLVMTEQTLSSLRARLPDSAIDIRRFRPNVLIDYPGAEGAWPEEKWVGRTLQIGDTRLEVVTACPRCVMITRPFDDLPEDRRIMRTVVREAEQNLGVYATIATPGTISVGDDVSLVD